MTTSAKPAGYIRLANVRLAFPKLFKPESVNGEGEPRYGAVFILPTDHPQIGALRAAIKAVAVDKWKDKADAVLKQLSAKDDIALHDGDSKATYDGFAGNLFVAANAKLAARPTVVDQNRAPLNEGDGKPYAGCYVNAIVEFWAQDNNWGKRVNAQLKGVQFVKDGDAFSAGAPAAADDFEAVEEGASAADFG